MHDQLDEFSIEQLADQVWRVIDWIDLLGASQKQKSGVVKKSDSAQASGAAEYGTPGQAQANLPSVD